MILIIKSTNAKFYKNEWDKLIAAINGQENIFIFDEILPKQELNSLFNLCHAYISLHRSEGLGIGLMTAMSLGKIAIATNYSGNLEFMNDQNSFLINYNLDTIKRHSGEYQLGQKWAEPIIEHAITIMRKVASNSTEVMAKGKQAKEDILIKHNYLKTKNEIKDSIERLINKSR